MTDAQRELHQGGCVEAFLASGSEALILCGLRSCGMQSMLQVTVGDGHCVCMDGDGRHPVS
jgi:hypothetical protein